MPSLEHQSHLTTHLRRLPGLESPDHMNTTTEPRKAREIQHPRPQIPLQIILPLRQQTRAEIHRYVHRLRRSHLHVPAGESPLADLSAAVKHRRRVVRLVPEPTEVRVSDRDLGDESEVEGVRGVAEPGDVDGSELESWRLRSKRDEGEVLII